MRGGAKSKNPISRRDYKKRKKELLTQLEGIEEEAPAIEYFELADPSKFDRSNELDRRTEPEAEPETIDILGRLDEASPPQTDDVEVEVPASPPMPPAPTPEPALRPAAGVVVAGAELAGLAPVDTSVNPLALDSTPPAASPVTEPPPPPPPAPPVEVAAASEASASAAELLARLKADQPIQSQFTSAGGTLDSDPFAPAKPTAAPEAAPVSSPHSQPAPSAPFAEVPAPTPAAAPVQTATNPFDPAGPSTPVRRPKTEPWTPPAPPPRGSNLEDMGAAAEVAVPDVLRAPQPAAPATNEAPGPPPADTDTSGQWIPPSLRGMASADDRAADPLPKRR